MTLVYRTAGAWGAGKGSPLTKAEADGNIWHLLGLIEAESPAPNGIATIEVDGRNMTITLDDATVWGPFELPLTAFRWVGVWAPATEYLQMDTVIIETGDDAGIYYALEAHTSATAFDPDEAGVDGPLWHRLFAAAAVVDGKTVRNGTTVPDNALGVDGDFYIRTSNWTIYGPKASGVWPSAVSLVGATGAAGTNGTDGLMLRSGAGAPSNGLGANGEFYIDTSAWNIHGPKASGTWPAGVSLIGPAGTNGTNGADGADGLGVPAGGTTNQVLAKASNADNDTAWVDAPVGTLANFSTTEHLTGAKWIDGTTPVYRKVVSIGALPNTAVKSVAHGITGLAQVVRISGTAKRTSDGVTLGLPHCDNPASDSININVNTTNVAVQTWVDRTSFDVTYAIIEYTKT